jgi:hypothetical protein
VTISLSVTLVDIAPTSLSWMGRKRPFQRVRLFHHRLDELDGTATDLDPPAVGHNGWLGLDEVDGAASDLDLALVCNFNSISLSESRLNR